MTFIDIIKSMSRYAVNHVKGNALKVKSVIVFDESPEAEMYHEYMSKHLTLDEIKNIVSSAIDKYKIEIRYTLRDKNYRVVIRDDDNVEFPVRKELGLYVPFKISHAYVFTNNSRQIDVTERVKKYAGQNGNFNAHAGYRVVVKDVFPFSDTDNYFKLLLVDETTLETRVFKMDDVITVI